MNTFTIEEHNGADDGLIFDLQNRVYPEHHLYRNRDQTEKYWQWRYYSHPQIRSRVYVVRDENAGILVGMRPVTFLPIQLKGNEVLSAWLTAVVTHPKFRRQGVFSNLVQHSMTAARKAGAEFAFTFPNEQSYNIYKKKNEWRYIGAIPLYVKLLKPVALIKMGLRYLPMFKNYVAAFSTPRCFDSGAGSTPVVKADHIRIHSIDHFNRDYDQLWSEATNGFKIVVKRDSAYLNWRYCEHPIANYKIFEARSGADNALLGYIVSTLQVRKEICLGLVVDLLVKNEEPTISRLLIKSATTFFNTSGVIFAAALMNKKHAYASSLMRCGFIPVFNQITPKRFHMIGSALVDNNAVGDYVLNLDNWHLTWGDTDNV